MMWHFLWLLGAQNLGCSIKGGVQVVQAQKVYNNLETTAARKIAPYEWTMAHAYMRKAREEYASGEYQRAAELSEEVIKWAEAAMGKGSNEEEESSPVWNESDNGEER